MAKYFFHILAPSGKITDAVGVEVPSLTSAHAARMIHAVLREVERFDNLGATAMEVVDEAGVLVVRVSLTVVKSTKAGQRDARRVRGKLHRMALH